MGFDIALQLYNSLPPRRDMNGVCFTPVPRHLVRLLSQPRKVILLRFSLFSLGLVFIIGSSLRSMTLMSMDLARLPLDFQMMFS